MLHEAMQDPQDHDALNAGGGRGFTESCYALHVMLSVHAVKLLVRCDASSVSSDVPRGYHQ